MAALASFDFRDNTTVTGDFQGTGALLAGQSITKNGITLTVDVAFSSYASASFLTDQAHHGVPKDVWNTFAYANAGAGTAITLSGIPANYSGALRFGGASGNAGRHRLLILAGTTYQNDNPGGTLPLVPEPPTEVPFTADANGNVSVVLDAASVNAAYAFIEVGELTPTVSITQTELTPGGTISGTYSNFGDTAPTALTLSDGTNTIGTATGEITGLTVDDVAKTFTATMPGLPTTGTTQGLLFGNVTATLSAPDVTAPTLTSATATSSVAGQIDGSVTTDEANGTLYYLATLNATETLATVKGGATQAVTATGVQSVTVTGLAAGTYYLHFAHTDSSTNDSAVLTSTSVVVA